MNPTILAALLNQIAVPELTRWLAELHAQDKVVTEEEALAKLELDAEQGDAVGLAFLLRTQH